MGAGDRRADWVNGPYWRVVVPHRIWGLTGPAGRPRVDSLRMSLSGDEFLRLESLIYRPVSTRPDWLKAWRNEANYLLFLARRASDADDIELLEELEDQAREMADMVEARWQAEGL